MVWIRDPGLRNPENLCQIRTTAVQHGHGNQAQGSVYPCETSFAVKEKVFRRFIRYRQLVLPWQRKEIIRVSAPNLNFPCT
jgi:hypothetical protein